MKEAIIRKGGLMAFVVAASLPALSSCGSARRSEPLIGDFTPATPEIAKGQAAFMRHCNQCHTGGETSFAPALNNKPAPGFLIKLQVRQGLGAMPAFPESEISASELDAIVEYLIALRREPAPPTQVASKRAP